LPQAKISVSMATAHGGSFSSLFWWFSLSILQGLRRTGTKPEILVRKSRENLLGKNLSIVVSFIVDRNDRNRSNWSK
jgi:hypothetical protein